jgi:hypothetical protein
MTSRIKQSVLDDGGYVRIVGRSMFPRLLPGSTVLVENVDIETLKMGDIVLVEREEKRQIHRLIRPIHEGKFQTAGDFCRAADSPLDIVHLKGRVPPPTHFFAKIIEALMCEFTLWRYN